MPLSSALGTPGAYAWSAQSGVYALYTILRCSANAFPDQQRSSTVSVQGVGQHAANFGPAEPLTTT